MHTNALAEEKSPYLRQHAHNPVDWLAWGERAFQKARSEDKPIFLSIGYSTCHWCHVMAHESFEDEQVAEVLNRFFVPIKIDREERPDVDRIYMLFVQATTGSGGWPMSVWLTPDLKPFFGGTYYAPDQRYGRPGFRDILLYLARAWEQDRDKINASGDGATDQLRSMAAAAPAGLQPDRELFGAAYSQFRKAFDRTWGGFGGAPKFPRPVVLNYLLRYYASQKNEEALDMVAQTLHAMADGGMHDQLGGGFHRYSVDERWFVPHFEKMLYDQAQLAVSFLEAFQITRDDRLAQVARGIFTYVLRDMTDSGGGFYSAEDADSPHPDDPSHSGEGAFYIWSQTELEQLLGAPNAQEFARYFGVESDGNVENDPHGEFTGRNILFVANSRDPQPASVAASIQILFKVREGRPRPHLDSKILTSWNAMMISALTKGYVVLQDSQYLRAAERALSFLLATMYNEESGLLMRRFCDGEAAVEGFLDDYAFLTQALLDLFEATSNPSYLKKASSLVRRGMLQFEDAGYGGFYSTVAGASDLLLRMKDDYDGAEPSGNSIATDVLLRLAHLTGDGALEEKASRALRSFAPKLKVQPTMAPQMTVALDRFLTEPEQIVIRCAEKTDEVEQLIASRKQNFAPYSTVLALTDDAGKQLSEVAPFLASLERKGRLTVYECRNLTCELPKVIN